MTKISDLVAASIVDPADIRFGVDQTDLSETRQLSLDALQKAGQLRVVDSIVQLLLVTNPRDGQLFQTKGYTTPGDGGGNLYRYDLASAATVDGGWIINGPSSVGRYLALDQSVANVRQFGAFGNGVVDDTTAIQAAVDAIYTKGGASGGGGAIYFPAGRYAISSTIDFDNLRGVKIYGDGHAGSNYAPAPSTPQSHSTILWNGADGGTMLTGGFSWCTIRDLSLWGRLQGGPTRAGVGIHQVTKTGVGSSSGSLESMTFNDLDICYKAGTSIADTNVDNMTFNHVVMLTANIGIQANNAQAVNFNALVLHTAFVSRVFEYNAGGNLYCGYLSTVQIEQVLQINGTGAGVGESNSTFTFNQIFIDPNQLVTPTLVANEAVDTAANRTVTFRSVRLPTSGWKSTGSYLVDVSGGIDVLVQNMNFLDTTDNILRIDNSFATADPVVLFERCAIESASTPSSWTSSPSFVTIVGSTTSGKWGFKDTVRKANSNIKLPDIGNHWSLTPLWGEILISNANETTLDVSGYGMVRMINNTAHTLSALTGGVDRQVVVFVFESGNNIIDFTGGELVGNAGADWHARNGDSMIATRYNGKWYCAIARSGTDFVVSFTANDATPSVLGRPRFQTANSVATTITALDDGTEGQEIFVLINDANTTVDFTATTLKGNGGADWTPTTGDHMVCTKIGSNWYCIVSDNTA